LGGKMSLSILIVDDNAVNLKVASLMLKKLGYQADLATNGIEAIEALEDQSYDIVLMDIQMPEMDGLEATKIIRQRWHQNPKIIVVTSLNNYREICLEAGADDFLTKPLGIETLRAAIEYHNPILLSDKYMSSGLVEDATTCDL
jgi:Response regulators consisting of a CheY-like receiver domain and a winged-helix DNA-binding domain